VRLTTIAAVLCLTCCTAAFSQENRYELKYVAVLPAGESVKVEVKSSYVIFDPSRGVAEKVGPTTTERRYSPDMVEFSAPSSNVLTWSFTSRASDVPPPSKIVFTYPNPLKQVPGKMAALFFDVSVDDTLPGAKTPTKHLHTFPLRLGDSGLPPRCLKIQRVPDGLAIGLKPDCSTPMQTGTRIK
jgi:hypothetical protein